MKIRFSNVVLIVLVVIAVGLSGMLIKDVVFGYDPSKYVELVDVNTISAEKTPTGTITDERVNEQINKYMSKYAQTAEVKDGNPQDNDVVVMDCTVEFDNNPDGNKQESDYEYTVGKTKTVFDGFDEQLKKMKPGETSSFNCPVIAEYQQNVNGAKSAKLTVTVKKITRTTVPEISDEYAKKIADVDSVAQLKEQTKKMMEYKAIQSTELQYRSALWGNIIDGSQVKYYPAKEMKRCKEYYIEPYRKEAESNSYTDLYKYISDAYNTDKSAFDEYIQNNAQEFLKQEMIIKLLIDKLNIEITDQYIKSRKDYYADYVSDDVNKMSADEIVGSEYFGNDETFMLQVKTDAIIDYIIKNNANIK